MGIHHLPHMLTVPLTKACLLCTTPADMDLYIQVHAWRLLPSAVPWISEDHLFWDQEETVLLLVYRIFVCVWWTCIEHGGILYMFVKRRLWCVKTTLMELLCMCLDFREIMPCPKNSKISYMALSRSTWYSIPQTQVALKVGDVFHFCYCVCIFCTYHEVVMNMHVLKNTCVAIDT